ncbi:MAG TPA: tetratricopeptide repeat protein [Acidimicrobiia bacterium]|jgi:tetratricopeptide (TPR) repeat protein
MSSKDRNPERRRRQGDGRRQPPPGRRAPRRRDRSITAVAGELPRWVRDEITRTTPKARREPALTHLARGVEAFADERYAAAYEQLKRAKDLAPQAATIRELLGLSAYNLEKWEEALRELRTFRRISGEPTQVPVEIDCLRALGRTEDAEKTFRMLKDLDPRPETDDEARVVFASSLLDRGLVGEAWKVIKPGRLVANPRPSALRRWYVAARVAHAAGDSEAARRFADAIAAAEPDFPGLPELRAEIAG